MSSEMSFCGACPTAKFISSRAPLECTIGRLVASRQTLPSTRIAKLCSTKYAQFFNGTSNTKTGRIVVDKVIGIIAIQGHTYGESANNYQLLGWHKVNQAFNGIHIFFGFHETSLENFWKILGSEGILPGGPAHVSSGWRGTRDMVYCSCNDPTSVSSRPNDGSGATSVANSATIHLEGLMRPIPAYKYLERCVTIQFDFITWQEDHPNQSCYVTPTWCLLIPGLVGK